MSKSRPHNNNTHNTNNTQHTEKVARIRVKTELTDSFSIPPEEVLDDYEIGNLLFGNSRGQFKFPDRDLVNSAPWETLTSLIESHGSKNIIYDSTYGEARGVDAKTGETVFIYFPYWWGGCTCGAEDYNTNLYESLLDKYFTPEEKELYLREEEFCDDDCEAEKYLESLSVTEWLRVRQGTNLKQYNTKLDRLCTCGARERNRKLREDKGGLEQKANRLKAEYGRVSHTHSSSCCLLRHNFIYLPDNDNDNKKLEIDWYKYPFRDAHTNREIDEEEFKAIIEDCLNRI